MKNQFIVLFSIFLFILSVSNAVNVAIPAPAQDFDPEEAAIQRQTQEKKKHKGLRN